jgi:dTMP kinase
VSTLGYFVVLEGIDGSGTTTQAELLGRALERHGRVPLVTREPTKGAVGTLIRQALEQKLTLDWQTMALLFAADRRDHAAREIVPALERGEVVVSDRYVLSSLVYQSATSPLGDAALPWLYELNRGVPTPDLTLVFDVPAEIAEQRRKARGGPAELYETSELQRRLALGYARAGELLPGENVQRVRAEESLEQVQAQIERAVLALLGAG